MPFYKKLYVVTANFTLYFLINRDFTLKGFEVIHIHPDQISFDLESYDDGFLISTPGERSLFPSLLRVILLSPKSYSVSRLLSLLSLENREQFRHEKIIIGIDPGDNLGISIRSNGIIIHEAVYFSVDGFLSHFKQLFFEIPAAHYLIRLGNGDLDFVVLLVNRFLAFFSSHHFFSYSFELVNESGSTRVVRAVRNKKRDELSAREISFRSGARINVEGLHVLQRSDLPVV